MLNIQNHAFYIICIRAYNSRIFVYVYRVLFSAFTLLISQSLFERLYSYITFLRHQSHKNVRINNIKSFINCLG